MLLGFPLLKVEDAERGTDVPASNKRRENISRRAPYRCIKSRAWLNLYLKANCLALAYIPNIWLANWYFHLSLRKINNFVSEIPTVQKIEDKAEDGDNSNVPAIPMQTSIFQTSSGQYSKAHKRLISQSIC